MSEKPKLVEQVSTDTNAPSAPDPFDAKALALPPDFFAAGGASNPKPKNVQVRKPHNQEWIRVHPDPDYRCNYGDHSSAGRSRILFVGARYHENDARASASKNRDDLHHL